jgi:hypothetical protein
MTLILSRSDVLPRRCGLPTIQGTIVLADTGNGIIQENEVVPGTFIAAVGADNPEKQELEPALLASATLVLDVLDRCAEIGEG